MLKLTNHWEVITMIIVTGYNIMKCENILTSKMFSLYLKNIYLTGDGIFS